MDEEYDVELKVKNDPPKTQNVPIVPKEEQMDGEEFDKMMEERFKNNPRFRFAEDADEAKRSMERNYLEPSAKDPTIWKVKCMVGCSLYRQIAPPLALLFLLHPLTSTTIAFACVYSRQLELLGCRLDVRGIQLFASCKSLLT
jgi:hypothetical protein